MSDIALVVTPTGDVRGLTEDDDRAWKRYKGWLKRLGAGEYFTFSYNHPRNAKMHKKFFSLVAYVADNSDVYDNREKALTAIKIAAGHCDFVPDPVNGGLVPVMRPINFAQMDQVAFEAFYDSAVNGVRRWVLPHMNRRSLDEAVEYVSRY